MTTTLNSVIVAGGAGFIGSDFVRLALDQLPDRIIVADKFTYAGNRSTLADVADHPRFELVEIDIADAEAVGRLYQHFCPRWVVNFAAESHVDRSIDSPRPFIESNVMGCFELLEAARVFLAESDERQRNRFRFLQVSTDEVYGSASSTDDFCEESPYRPNSPYAASKAAADHLVRAYHVTYGLPVLLTNCSNNYGPYQFPEKLIPRMILMAMQGNPLPIYGDGLQVRDWLHVRDHCEGILTVLEDGVPGEKYNIGNDDQKTNIEVVEALCRVLEELFPSGQNPNIKGGSYSELLSYVADRPGHDRRYAIDASKIASELGWKTSRSFEEGLRQTVRWYIEHQAWCSEVLKATQGEAPSWLSGHERVAGVT